MNQGRGFRFFGISPNTLPGLNEVMRIRAQVGLADSDTGGAHDETASRHFFVGMNLLNQFAKACSFGIRINFAGNAQVFDRRHVNKIATGQSDVRSYAGAFLSDGFFRNLDQNLLTFFEQIADCGLFALLAPGGTTASTTAAAGGPAAITRSRC